MVEVFIPLRTHSQVHGRKREHWARRAESVRQDRMLVWVYMRDKAPPALPALVTLVRVSPRPLDTDNLRPALKQVRDEVAKWLGLPQTKRGQADDRDPRVAWRYQQGPRNAGEHGVLVQAEAGTQAQVDEVNSAEKWRP